MESVQIWLTFPERVIQLGFEGDVVVEIVASAKRRAVAQADIIEHDVCFICIYVLVSDKGPNLTKPLGKLGIECRHIYGWSVIRHVADEKSLVEYLDTVRYINHVRVHNGLTDSNR